MTEHLHLLATLAVLQDIKSPSFRFPLQLHPLLGVVLFHTRTSNAVVVIKRTNSQPHHFRRLQSSKQPTANVQSSVRRHDADLRSYCHGSSFCYLCPRSSLDLVSPSSHAPIAALMLHSNSSTGVFTCPFYSPNGAFCADTSLSSNIIIRCSDGVGQPGNCVDNLSGTAPVQVFDASCWQTTETSGDAVCAKKYATHSKWAFHELTRKAVLCMAHPATSTVSLLFQTALQHTLPTFHIPRPLLQ